MLSSRHSRNLREAAFLIPFSFIVCVDGQIGLFRSKYHYITLHFKALLKDSEKTLYHRAALFTEARNRLQMLQME